MGRKVSIKSDLKDSNASFYANTKRDPNSSIGGGGFKNALINRMIQPKQPSLVPIEEDFVVRDMFEYSHNRLFTKCSFTTVTRYFNGFIDQFKNDMPIITHT